MNTYMFRITVMLPDNSSTVLIIPIKDNGYINAMTELWAHPAMKDIKSSDVMYMDISKSF